ncbi:hypothetical protein B9T10_02270 [Wohlfahrtiimonas chitiniclastica]|uniref:hypothetical protein n=1 Tax=Wohlfahrtiimonas chitiniclastica TaxID=400946 RepID=UPI000B991B12|nr:hypothetical protein [Wohlfahrtiimonas chitiniclastica]OYQ90167.1 hypothetical protein B9T10_02270 [Wohlfahrtiimonas chitiniclastica]
MKYFTNKKTSKVCAYESIEEAKAFNDDFENLVEMTDEQFIQFRDHKPKGGKWTYQGWIIDDNLLKKEQAQEAKLMLQKLLDEKSSLQSDMNMYLLLDEKEEAKSVAQKIKDINSEIEKLKE